MQPGPVGSEFSAQGLDALGILAVNLHRTQGLLPGGGPEGRAATSSIWGSTAGMKMWGLLAYLTPRHGDGPRPFLVDGCSTAAQKEFPLNLAEVIVLCWR